MKTAFPLIIATLLLLNCAINAQNKTNLEVSYSNLFYKGDYKPLVPFGLSVEPSFEISKRISLATGINVFYKRAHFNLVSCDIMEGPSEWTSNFVYLGIPLYFKYNIFIKPKFEVYTKLGGKGIFLFDHVTYNNAEIKPSNFFYPTKTYFNFGLGGTYKLNQKVSLFCESNGLANWNQYGFVLDTKIGGIFNIR